MSEDHSAPPPSSAPEVRAVTPAGLRAEAAEYEAKAKRLLEQAANNQIEARNLLDVAEKSRSLAELMENPQKARVGLTSDADSTTLQNVSAISSADLARGMSRSRSKKHPFVRALYEHPDPKKRMTVSDWAEKQGYKIPTVASWFARGKGARRIPQKIAEKIEKELGVPATLAVWKNGILTED